MRAGHDQHSGCEHGRTMISGRKARQGEIILRTRRRRVVFVVGLIGFVVLATLLNFTWFYAG